MEKSSDALRFGLLGAARIAPDAMVKPAWSYDGAVVRAVAARSEERANTFAQRWGVPKAYGGATAYQGQHDAVRREERRFCTAHLHCADLVDDPDLDAIYIGVSDMW